MEMQMQMQMEALNPFLTYYKCRGFKALVYGRLAMRSSNFPRKASLDAFLLTTSANALPYLIR